jgi:hypothetical protein
LRKHSKLEIERNSREAQNQEFGMSEDLKALLDAERIVIGCRRLVVYESDLAFAILNHASIYLRKQQLALLQEGA